ncbi:MAG TPA: response regulator [Ktedonobacterales bacterium]|nr:response regulator [Ktedonobacterales bacterium]
MGQQSDGRAPETIHLLIVDDMAETAQNVQKLLHFERDIRVVGIAASGREAIQKADQLRPDVILMDINLRDMDGLEVAEIIGRQINTCIVMMSVQSEPEYFSQAMSVGARGYLVKPFTSEKLVRTIRRAVENFPLQSAQAMGGGLDQRGGASNGLRKIVAVYSPKGGAGTSVLAANMAIALQQTTQKSVVLVDANLQNGDAHVLLNVNTSASIDDLREAGSGVIDQDVIEGTVIKHSESEIGLLRAPLSPESAELFTSDTTKAILSELRNHFDYVVVDTGSSFTEATLTVLEEADVIITVTTLEVTTIHRVSQFFQLAERVNISLSKVRLVCNRVEQYYGIKPNQVESQLRRRFFAQIPEDEKLVVASINRGVPFIVSQKAAPISRAVQTLAGRVAEVLAPQSDPTPSRRWPAFLGNNN